MAQIHQFQLKIVCVGATSGKLTGIAAVLSDSTFSISAFSCLCLPQLTVCSWGRDRVAGLRKGQVGGKECWSLQLEGDLDHMVASLLQMHFTFPYLPLAHSRTVTDRALSQPLCVWRWMEGVGGSGTCSGP